METLIKQGWPEELQEHIADDLVELDVTSIRGVYFLFRNNDLLYIGKSNNIRSRINEHKRRLTFDKVLYLPMVDYMDAIETQLILHFKPKLNITNNPDNMPKGRLSGKPGVYKHVATAKYQIEDFPLILKRASEDVLNEVLSTITDIERDVIVKRYGLFGSERQTLQEIGNEHNITRQRINQIQKKAEHRIQHPSRMNALLKKPFV